MRHRALPTQWRDTLLAIELEERDGAFTGRVLGVPSSGEGKVVRVKEQWGDDVLTRSETWFYSDSVRDLPLLEAVTHAIAVNPDATLDEHARLVGWPIVSTRRDD